MKKLCKPRIDYRRPFLDKLAKNNFILPKRSFSRQHREPEFAEPKGARLLFELAAQERHEGCVTSPRNGVNQRKFESGDIGKDALVVRTYSSTLYNFRFWQDKDGSRRRRRAGSIENTFTPRTGTTSSDAWRGGSEFYVARNFMSEYGLRLQRERTSMQRACAAWNRKCTPTRAMPPLNLDLHPRFPAPHGQPGAPNLQNPSHRANSRHHLHPFT